MIEVFMPKLGPSMDQGTIVRWHKAPGDAVRKGEPILEIETDKTVQEVEAEAEGILREILVAEGQSCAVGTVLALLGAQGDAPTAAASEQPRPAIRVEADSERRVSMQEKAVVAHARRDEKALPLRSSPAARRVARENGIDLAAVNGTGPHGRIVADDVLREVASRPAGVPATGPGVEARARPSPLPESDIRAVKERIALSAMRRTTGERMTLSKQAAPHFYVSMHVDMRRVQERRAAWKERGETAIPSYNDFVLWAAARTLKAFPALNSSLSGDEITVFADVNIGMATAVQEGLIVPVIHRADRLSVRGMASRTGELATKARDRKLAAVDCDGGTFTVSNLGMLGVDSFVAIINPPQAAILAVGQVAPRVVTDGRSISICPMTTMTLSVDHRVADGVVASRFLGALKEALEGFGDEE